MNVLVTRGSGPFGQSVVSRLAQNGYRVLPLRPTSPARGVAGPTWNPEIGQVHLDPAGPPDAVLHLAGETILQRWTLAPKERIRASLVDATRLRCGALARLPKLPRVLMRASARRFYGNRGDEVLDEESSESTGFLPKVCQACKAAAQPARQQGIRVVHWRIGLRRARHEGALSKMLPAFRLGLGGRLRTDRQYWSWIALENWLRVMENTQQDDRSNGAVNALSSKPIPNTAFTKALRRALRRPAFLPMPAAAVKLIFGKMGHEALTAIARVRPEPLLESGLKFCFLNLDAA